MRNEVYYRMNPENGELNNPDPIPEGRNVDPPPLDEEERIALEKKRERESAPTAQEFYRNKRNDWYFGNDISQDEAFDFAEAYAAPWKAQVEEAMQATQNYASDDLLGRIGDMHDTIALLDKEREKLTAEREILLRIINQLRRMPDERQITNMIQEYDKLFSPKELR